MMITKTEFLKSMDDLPEEFTIDEILDRVLLLQKIEAGLQDSDDDNVISQKEAEDESKTWFR